MNEPNYEKFWKEAKEELAYWKEMYEAMKERCEAAEHILSHVPIDQSLGRINLYLPGFDEALKKWQSLKQKQP